MAKFLELLERSVIIQALLALGCLGSIIYLIIVNAQVPDVLVNAFLLILGFYFGSKAQTEVTRFQRRNGG